MFDMFRNYINNNKETPHAFCPLMVKANILYLAIKVHNRRMLMTALASGRMHLQLVLMGGKFSYSKALWDICSSGALSTLMQHCVLQLASKDHLQLVHIFPISSRQAEFTRKPPPALWLNVQTPLQNLPGILNTPFLLERQENRSDASISMVLMKNDSSHPGIPERSARSPCSSSYHSWQGCLECAQVLHFLIKVSEFLSVSLRNTRHL